MEKNAKQLIQAVGIVAKWKHYRDVHYRLYEVTDDEEGYKRSMKEYQVMIKRWMMEYEQTIAATVTEVCRIETDARVKVKFIAAGYDLAMGNDYTREDH